MSIKAAVVGAAGYSGEELLRLLTRHSQVEIEIITSRKYAGKSLGSVSRRFWDSPLYFSEPDTQKIAATCDAAFLALPHGLASEYAIPLLKSGIKVIDISADFRLNNSEKYQEYYGTPHPAPELLQEAVYGLPEHYRNKIKQADLIACPGCYPTSSILPIVPLLRENLVSHKNITIVSMSGVTGAGRKVDLPFIFPECNESVRAYSPQGHRHIPEIEQQLSAATITQEAISINFIPHLVPVNRGINSTIILEQTANCSLEKVGATYKDCYSNEPFVRVLAPEQCSDTKNVAMSNCCEIGFTIDRHTGKLIVTSCIDNLTKGASGQAIQCMNLMFDLPETTGLL